MYASWYSTDPIVKVVGISLTSSPIWIFALGWVALYRLPQRRTLCGTERTSVLTSNKHTTPGNEVSGLVGDLWHFPIRRLLP